MAGLSVERVCEPPVLGWGGNLAEIVRSPRCAVAMMTGYGRTVRWRLGSGARLSRLAFDRNWGAIVIEATNLGSPWPSAGLEVGRSLGIQVVLAPQNIESLVQAREERRGVPVSVSGFAAELKSWFGRAPAIVISQEEEWLLRGAGCRVSWLPYFPPERVERDLVAVRSSRSAEAKGPVLILGSATNTPTREGMRRQLEVLRSCSELKSDRFLLAGFGTEAFANDPLAENVEVLGGVEGTSLMRLMGCVRALWVHQEWGFGALTRIQEALIAGVPVIANRIAARSYHGVAGVHEYSSEKECMRLLAGVLPVPPMPRRPENMADELIALLQPSGKEPGGRSGVERSCPLPDLPHSRCRGTSAESA